MSEDVFARRFRLIVCSLVLAAIAMIQQPGRIVSDTKLDLVVAPARFLGRATSLWDPIGYFGQVQNQAYGYFVPMGPFFWVGDALQIEPWVTQRLWWALVLIVAFWGFVLLARELRIGADWTHVVGGFAFALSPRMLTVLGPSSIEVWPMALAPWVLLALVVGTHRRSPVGMAALSAVAVALVGGVNAAATFSVVPLGVLWLVMAPPGRRRRLMMITWPAFVLLGTLWWIVPLLLLGQYSPPFLNFIESAPLTTFDTTLVDALRGTSNWTAYLSNTGVAGVNLVSEPVLLLNLAVALTLAVVGLARRDLPHRRFLFVAVLIGLLFVTLGHTASHGGWGAHQAQVLLDGVLSPLRNTHKFDVVIRIPLVLALVHALTVAARRRESSPSGTTDSRLGPGVGIALLGVIAVVGSTTPAWTGQIAPKGSFEEVPGYWKQTAGWLAKNNPKDRALVLPASAFGSYLWGYTNDDVMQPLAEAPWGVRNAIPLVPPGNIEMLDAVEREISEGRGSQALQDYLLNGGVSLLVVRNDLVTTADGLDPEIVHAAVAGLPNVRRVASFGPKVGGAPTITKGKSRFFIDQGWQAEHPAVEVYRVGYRPRVRAEKAAAVPVVIGAADSHVGLLSSGLVTNPSVVYASDAPGDETPNRYVLTDGHRRQEVAFGRVHHNRSSSIARGQDFEANRLVHQYATDDDPRWSSVPELQGARRIVASSSQASILTPGQIDQASQPWAAFDADPLTAWKASTADIGKRSWLRLEFNEPTDVSAMSITVDGDPLDMRTIAVRTDDESAVIEARGGRSTRVQGLTKSTRSVEISAPSAVDDLLAIRDVAVPGVSLARPLVLPAIPGRWGSPDSIMLQAGSGYRSGCLVIQGYQRCAAGQDSWGEDGRTVDRQFTLPEGRTYPLSLTAEPIGGPALDKLVQGDQLVTVEATSQVVRAAQASSINAVDGSDKTSWVAAPGDRRPRLTVSWLGKRQVSSLVARLDKNAAASRPTRATLRFPDGTRHRVRFDTSGRATFPAVETRQVEIEFTESEVERNLDTAGGAQELPVGVSEIRLPRTSLLPIDTDTKQRRYRCGSGPAIDVDGEIVRTRITASPADLLSGAQLEVLACGDRSSLALGAGTHRIRVIGTDAVRPVQLSLGETAERTDPTSVQSDTDDAVRRQVQLREAFGVQLLAATENTNTGWVANDGAERPVVVNGWQQGWYVGSGVSDVDLVFEPNRLYRTALLGGAVLVVVLAGLAFAWRRRADDSPAASPREPRARWMIASAVTCVAAGLALGGLIGMVAGLAGYAVASLTRRRLDPSWLAGALVGGVALAGAVRPWGGAASWLGTFDWPQVMIAVALGVVAASVFGWPNLRRRSVGTSTQA